jgi:uncharacterized protein with PQ loop repeat
MDHDLGHVHLRKRISNMEPYPSTDRLKRAIDYGVYLVSILGVVFTIPQMITIWINRNASGVSAISWIAYVVTALFWIFYGVIHREKPIIWINILWVICDLIVVVGAIKFG